ncbi:MAG TPA: Maf family protein [Pirellulaceae bacterium]|nr:Maf family protein [Pirellulaceae bacterium]
MERLILASGSPRRRELLMQAGYEFEVIVPDESVEADCPRGESLEETVLRLAQSKARDVARRIDRGIVLAADTLVECGGLIFGKPADRNQARQMLHQLSGRTHRVLTGVVLLDARSSHEVSHVETSLLRMAPLNDQLIETYLDSGQWFGKAGAFGYQDGWDWLTMESGSESNVVGLPVERLPEILIRLNQSMSE